MTLDEIFDSMTDAAADAGYEYLVIDPDSRQIKVPEAEKIFGVVSDENAVRKYFLAPRYVGDNLDLAGMFLTVYFRNAAGEEDGYLVNDVQVVQGAAEYVTFSWELRPKVTAYMGTVQFSVCADLPNTGTHRRPDWNTTTAQGEVLEGLHPDAGDVEEGTSDVVAQLREMVTAQTAAVEATGAAQIDAVEAAGAAATATAQAQIEAKGAATLATIPEDYTNLANKTNEQANAIKGHLFGQIVRADDVSPVEHYPAITIRSRNMFPCMAAGTSTIQVGVTLTYNDDGSVTMKGTATDNINFVVGTINLPAGDMYRLCDFAAGAFPADNQARVQVYSESAGKAIATYNESAGDFIAGENSSFTKGPHQCRIRIEKGHTYDCTLRPVLLKDETPTEYIPYVMDLAAVTVKRHGKNLFAVSLGTINGVTLSKYGDYFVLNGTATESGNFVANIGYLPAGKYTLSANNPAHNNVDYSLVDVFCSDPYSIIAVRDTAKNGVSTAELAEGYNYMCRVRIEKGKTYNYFVIKPQLEQGTVATAYEPHQEPVTAMPDAAGTVTGLPSVAPSMHLQTDTPNTTVECEYNRDSNAVYAELLAKIAALSGTT